MMRTILVLIFSSYDHTCLDCGSSLFTIGFVPPQWMSVSCRVHKCHWDCPHYS